ncbi:MAG TPA: hypothetical protein VHV28_02400 [Solirubrobacteraceae bacterium]|nr:hypothetical protein [Solirubrobacteraceae bacterium]
MSVLSAGALALIASAIGAGPALGATPFQRGDVFLTGSGSVQEFSPTGDLVQTVSGTTGADGLCFDPSGAHLIVPGVGLFDSAGNLLPSAWASSQTAIHCVADARGNVYVSGQASAPLNTFNQYDLEGHLIRARKVTPYPAGGFMPPAIDLAPDECSMYWGVWDGSNSTAGQLNVCTESEETPVVPTAEADDLRVLPDSELLVESDSGATLYDASGTFVRGYNAFAGGVMRSLALDPDGTSFWMSSPFGPDVFRFDIASGDMVPGWSNSTALGPIAVYSPPLFGDADIGSTLDSDSPGTAEAFATRVGVGGQLTRLRLWLDPRSTATKVVVGVYATQNGQPGALLRQATISAPDAGAWNLVNVSALSVTPGQRLWIAVLGPKGAGTIRFHDASQGGPSYTSLRTKLTSLPAHWVSGQAWTSSPLSAFGG